MAVFKLVGCLVVLLGISAGSPVDSNILDFSAIDFSAVKTVAQEPVPKVSGRQVSSFTPTSLEDGQCGLRSYESGFGRLTRVGLSVAMGTSAVLPFEVTINAIDAPRIDNNDELFDAVLTPVERTEYQALKEVYDGGLRIPMFQLIGIDLSMNRVFPSPVVDPPVIANLEDKMTAISQILTDLADTRILLRGSLTATGVSRGQTVVFAFTPIVQIRCEVGSVLIVPSTGESLTAASRGGNIVDSSDNMLEIACTSGSFC